MGWNNVTLSRQHPLFCDVPKEAEFYFCALLFSAPGSRNRWVRLYGLRDYVLFRDRPEESGRPSVSSREEWYAGLKDPEKFLHLDGY